MSFIDHLEALRWHLVRCVIVWAVAFIGIFVKVDWVFDHIIYAPAKSNFVTYGWFCDLSHFLRLGNSLCMPAVEIPLQGNTISGPFMSALSISMVGGLILAFPYLFWELWRFIKPALSAKEVRYSRGSIFWVSLCFFTGGAFGYFLLAPFTFNFLANFSLGTTGAYKYMPTLTDYIDTITTLILGCGIAFELPVIAYVLAKIGLVTAPLLRGIRKYAFVVILLLAAIITPSPDWTSQIIVALPLLLLYEIGVFLVARVDKQKAKEEKEWS
ncbi:MAG: twin-arginine translocase subunit TatC [Gloeobacteraceae cyanobacterium ES-bin-316]|nr:twin-arginine translocase subunit TatC [Ferruginibacter sp.]